MNKIVGFYGSCLFNEKWINDCNGVICEDDNKNRMYLSNRELKKRYKKMSEVNDENT